MTLENALWVAGILLLPAIGWGLRLTSVAKETRKNTEELLVMQGTTIKALEGNQKQLMDNQRDIVRSSDRADATLRELIHYVKWATKQQTGTTPPPLTPEV